MNEFIQKIIDFFSSLFGGSAVAQDTVPGTAQPGSSILKKYPSWRQYDAHFQLNGARFGVPWTYLKAIAIVESSLGKYRDGYDGKSAGLMHLVPATANDMAVALGLAPNLTMSLIRADDELSIKLAAQYLKKSQDRYPGNVEAQIKSYNMGWGNTDKWLKGTGKDYSTITSDYYNKWKKAHAEVLKYKDSNIA